jgi:hypothetical protein
MVSTTKRRQSVKPKKQTREELLSAMKRKQKAFAKLTPSQKRVAIAKDVIAQLDTRRLRARTMTYVYLVGPKPKASYDQQVCDLTVGRNCQVCALGAMFVVAVERADKLNVSDNVDFDNRFHGADGETCYSYLAQFFSTDQLHQIEAAFEGFDGIRWAWAEDTDVSPEERMRRVMTNVIRNRGRFNWSQPAVRSRGTA